MDIRITPREVDAIAKEMAARLKMSFLTARGMAKRFHPDAEDSAVKILNEYKEEGVRSWWRRQREEHVETAKIYKGLMSVTAKKQGRVRITRLLR